MFKDQNDGATLKGHLRAPPFWLQWCDHQEQYLRSSSSSLSFDKTAVHHPSCYASQCSYDVNVCFLLVICCRMYEKNGTMTSPVVDANNVSIGTRKTLLSRKEVDVEAIFFFFETFVYRLSFYRKSSGHFTTGNDFSAVSGSPAAAGDEQRASWLTIETPQSHWHDVGRSDVLLQLFSVQA